MRKAILILALAVPMTGVAGDFEFSQWIGDMAAEAIIDRFNNIDGI